MAFLDAFVVNVVVPTIDEELGAWVDGRTVDVPERLAGVAALDLPAGALGDRYGDANTFVIGVAGFEAASALAGARADERSTDRARERSWASRRAADTGQPGAAPRDVTRRRGRVIGAWTTWTSAADRSWPGGRRSHRRGPFLARDLSPEHPVRHRDRGSDARLRDICGTEPRDRHLDVYELVLGTIAVGALVSAPREGPETAPAARRSSGAWCGRASRSRPLPRRAAPWPSRCCRLSLFRIRQLSVANLAAFFAARARWEARSSSSSSRAVGPRPRGDQGRPRRGAGQLARGRRIPFRPGGRPARPAALPRRRSRCIDRHRPGAARSPEAGRELLGRGLSGVCSSSRSASPRWSRRSSPPRSAAPEDFTGTASGMKMMVQCLGQLVAVVALELVAPLVDSVVDGSPIPSPRAKCR